MRNAVLYIKCNLTIITTLLVLSACASPAVDTTAPTFDETKYTVDLDTCRGGSALKTALNGLGGAVIGSVIGAADGAYHGAIAGDAPEGAIIGAIAGSVVGVVWGCLQAYPRTREERSAVFEREGLLVEVVVA